MGASWTALRKEAGTPGLVGPGPLRKRLETSWEAAVMTNKPDEIGRFLADEFLFVGAGGLLQTGTQTPAPRAHTVLTDTDFLLLAGVPSRCLALTSQIAATDVTLPQVDRENRYTLTILA